MNLIIKNIYLITFGLLLGIAPGFSQSDTSSPEETPVVSSGDSDALYYYKDESTNKEETIGLPDNNKDDFITGIKSPHEENVWIYASRNTLSEPTTLYKYNNDRNLITKLVAINETPENNLSFVPIAFGSNPDIIYLEANDYIRGAYSMGVWEYNLSTKVFTQLAIDENYMMTPVIDTDRQYLYYNASTASRNLVHGNADISYKYDLQSNQETTLDSSTKLVEKNLDGSLRSPNNCLPAIDTDVIYFFPYEEGQYFCLGRMGNTPPCSNNLPLSPNCNNHPECPHGSNPYGGSNNSTCTVTNTNTYIAFDVENSDYHNDIYAAAFGKVTFRGTQSGYGRCIEILHADGYSTFYAHLSGFNVQMDEIVDQFTVIGTEGGSYVSTNGGTINETFYGEHLHFEVRSSAGVKGTDYVKFMEFNHQSANYRNAGNALAKTPVPAFVSNIDLAPICNSMTIAVDNNYVFVSDLFISNFGDELSGGFKIYFSLVNGNSQTSLGHQTISSLNAESTIAASPMAFTIPSTPNGNYAVKIYVESDDFATSNFPQLVEYDFSNNICQSSNQITIGGPTASCFDGIQNQGELEVDCGGPCSACQTQANLASTSCTAPIVNGDQLQVFYEISNSGSQNAGSFPISWFLYKLGNNTPISFSSTTWVPGVPGNTSQTFLKTFSLNTEMNAINQTAGEYRVAMIIDNGNYVQESNENDNFCIGTTYFEYSTANLTHTSSCLSTVSVGDNLDVYYHIVNTGNSNAGYLTVSWYVYEEFGNNPIYLSTDNDVLGPTANSTKSFSRTIDLLTEMAEANLPPGNYRLGFYIDSNHSVIESDENDNFCSASATFSYGGGCSDPDGYIDGYYTGVRNFSAPNYIYAPNTGNQTIIPAGSDMTFSAGQTIRLLPGFRAYTGSKFHAKIEECVAPSNLVEPEEEESTAAKEEAPQELSDIRVFPNPFSGQSTIEFKLAAEKEVTVFITDITGKRIATLTEGSSLSDGTHRFVFDGSRSAPGMYYCKIQAGEYSNIQKMILVK